MSHWKICVGVLGLGIFFGGCATHSGSKAVRSEPRNEKASIQYDFAFDAYMNGEMIPALGAIMRTIELAPQNAESHNLMGLIYFRQGKLDLAEAAFKRAVDLDPKMSESFNNLGSLYLAQNKFAEAKDALLKAQENPLYLYPERIMNNLGLAYQGLGQSAEAEKAFLESIRLSKDFYLPYVNVGRILHEQGQLPRAETYLKEAARTCSECPEPRYLLGRIYLTMNRQDDALKMFKEGAKIDPQGEIGLLCQQYLVQR